MLSVLTPVLSLLMREPWFSKVAGSSVCIKTRMPMPPIHWAKERHSRKARGRSPIFKKTVAPVVVKADTDSKNAEKGECSSPAIR